MRIKIKNLLVRTIIGFKEWEREKKQDVLINVIIYVEDLGAIKSDNIQESVDYKIVTKRIIEEVEKSNFFLLEKLSGFILDIVMEDRRVKKAIVEVEKPHALRFAESVSVRLERER